MNIPNGPDPQRAIDRALLDLGDRGGPVSESVVGMLNPAALDAMVDRGLLHVSDPVYTLTAEGLREYSRLAAERNERATL
jgi:hypothetical protein